MPITKSSKSKPKNAHIIDSKPAQLARMIYAVIVRYTKAKNAKNRDKNANFILDVERKSRYVVDSDI